MAGLARDRDRLWFRAEGDGEDGRVGEAQTHVLYGRQCVALVGSGRRCSSGLPSRDPQTWAAVGVQGLAPYWFDIEATAYVGASGRTHARFEVEYELLLTNRLVLQPLLEVELSGKSDPERGIGAGLSTTDAGLRLRYEFSREFAPYVGVTWNRKYGEPPTSLRQTARRRRTRASWAGLRTGSDARAFAGRRDTRHCSSKVGIRQSNANSSCAERTVVVVGNQVERRVSPCPPTTRVPEIVHRQRRREAHS